MGDAGFEFFWLPLASLTNSVDLCSKVTTVRIVSANETDSGSL